MPYFGMAYAFKLYKKIIASLVVMTFLGSLFYLPTAQADALLLPKPGVMVPLSPEYTPAYLKGIVIHPENALKFDFIIHRGDKSLNDAQKREEYTKLTKYFLASLAIPDEDQWVNLSPYEKDRIIKDNFGKTEMGRDLLAQDYLLKQITASLIYPEDRLGKEFWNKVYAQAQKQFGTTNIPVNTFNKVWILPDDALIYEKGNTAYVLKNHLRVMLEEDYLSFQKHSGIESAPTNGTHNIASKIVREIVLSELQKEVNEGKNFAPLRQVYSGMLLATWFKRTLKQSVLGQIYANKGKVRGVDQDPKSNEEIYQQYLKAYKKGVFNFIKEDVDKYTNETVPRKYFSGGAEGYVVPGSLRTAYSIDSAQTASIENLEPKLDFASVVMDRAMVLESNDAAMMVGTDGAMRTSEEIKRELGLIQQEVLKGAADGQYVQNKIPAELENRAIKLNEELEQAWEREDAEQRIRYANLILGKLNSGQEMTLERITPTAQSSENIGLAKQRGTQYVERLISARIDQHLRFLSTIDKEKVKSLIGFRIYDSESNSEELKNEKRGISPSSYRSSLYIRARFFLRDAAMTVNFDELLRLYNEHRVNQSTLITVQTIDGLVFRNVELFYVYEDRLGITGSHQQEFKPDRISRITIESGLLSIYVRNAIESFWDFSTSLNTVHPIERWFSSEAGMLLAARLTVSEVIGHKTRHDVLSQFNAFYRERRGLEFNLNALPNLTTAAIIGYKNAEDVLKIYDQVLKDLNMKNNSEYSVAAALTLAAVSGQKDPNIKLWRNFSHLIGGNHEREMWEAAGVLTLTTVVGNKENQIQNVLETYNRFLRTRGIAHEFDSQHVAVALTMAVVTGNKSYEEVLEIYDQFYLQRRWSGVSYRRTIAATLTIAAAIMDQAMVTEADKAKGKEIFTFLKPIFEEYAKTGFTPEVSLKENRFDFLNGHQRIKLGRFLDGLHIYVQNPSDRNFKNLTERLIDLDEILGQYGYRIMLTERQSEHFVGIPTPRRVVPTLGPIGQQSNLISGKGISFNVDHVDNQLQRTGPDQYLSFYETEGTTLTGSALNPAVYRFEDTIRGVQMHASLTLDQILKGAKVSPPNRLSVLGLFAVDFEDRQAFTEAYWEEVQVHEARHRMATLDGFLSPPNSTTLMTEYRRYFNRKTINDFLLHYYQESYAPQSRVERQMFEYRISGEISSFLSELALGPLSIYRLADLFERAKNVDLSKTNDLYNIAALDITNSFLEFLHDKFHDPRFDVDLLHLKKNEFEETVDLVTRYFELGLVTERELAAFAEKEFQKRFNTSLYVGSYKDSKINTIPRAVVRFTGRVLPGILLKASQSGVGTPNIFISQAKTMARRISSWERDKVITYVPANGKVFKKDDIFRMGGKRYIFDEEIGSRFTFLEIPDADNIKAGESFAKGASKADVYRFAEIMVEPIDEAMIANRGSAQIENNAARNRKNNLQINQRITPGGIDLNSANLAMTIKRDGKGVPLPLAQQDLAQLSNIEGLDPVILSIHPASQTALFAELIAHP